MRLGIDLDGVVYNYVEDFQNYARTYFPYHDSPDFKCDEWNFFEEWGMSAEEFVQINEEGVAKGVIFADGNPILDALTALRQLKADGHYIHIITHRTFGPKCLENTGKWLEKHQVPHDAVTFVEDKTVVNVDILLDDRDTNIVAALSQGVDAVMFDAPYNKSINLPRVHGWDHFYQYVHDRANAVAEEAQADAAPAESPLLEAENLIKGARQGDYGHPRDDFARTAKMWSAILDTNVEAHHVPLMMISVKMSRELNRHKRDNSVDIAGYAGTLEMLYD